MPKKGDTRRNHKPINVKSVPALDCDAIGCNGNLSHRDYEEGSGFWLRYQKKEKSNVWRFTIKVENARIDWKDWLEGTKPRARMELFDTPEEARVAFNKLLAAKKSAGYQFVHATW